jgi:transposase
MMIEREYRRYIITYIHKCKKKTIVINATSTTDAERKLRKQKNNKIDSIKYCRELNRNTDTL